MNIRRLTPDPAELLAQSAVKKAGQKRGKPGRQNGPPPNSNFKETKDFKGYSVEISPDGMRKTEETDNKLQKMAAGLQSLTSQLENTRGRQGETEGEIRAKCMLIAMRIISGDNVPFADHQYLMKHDPELYATAISRRIPKPDPEKHDRLSEDEESGDSGMTDGSAVEKAPDEAQGAGSAGTGEEGA